MYLTGFADEASQNIDQQIKATKELGWKNIESRCINGVNLTNVTDAEFDTIAQKLTDANIQINCFGSAIANWAKKINEDADTSLEETERAIVRMKKLGTPLIRIMSYAVLPDREPKDQMIEKRVERLKRIVGRFQEEGLTPVHENCMNYGGMGASYTLELIQKVPGLKLVYDTGNPVFTDDRDQSYPYPKQSSLAFYQQVKDHIEYVHIKDGKFDFKENKTIYTFPGEGDGDVVAIVEDLVKNGYDGGFSMEPHMASVFHEKDKSSAEDKSFENYVEYGKRFMKILDQLGVKNYR